LQFISVEDSTRSVHASRVPLQPASPHLRSEVSILTAIAEATVSARHGIGWQAMRDDYRRIREHIARVVPGCESYEVNVHRPGGYVMPHPPRESRSFDTPIGPRRVRGVTHRGAAGANGACAVADPAQPRPVQHHIYGLSDRYRGIEGGRRVMFMHRDDITTLGFNNGDRAGST
jgi:formate dehydrogenase major subunit